MLIYHTNTTFNQTFIFQVEEKIVLPSADDLKAEKTHENLQKGIEGFTPDKLKAVKTKEPATGAECKKLLENFFIHLYSATFF